MKNLLNKLLELKNRLFEKLPPIELGFRQILLILLLAQTVTGIFLFAAGTLYTEIDTRKAEEMLAFIQTANPEYHQQIIEGEDSSYRKEFYSHYKRHGHRGMLIVSGFFMFISMNLAIALVYVNFMGGKKEEPEEVEGEETEGEEGEEEGEDDDSESF